MKPVFGYTEFMILDFNILHLGDCDDIFFLCLVNMKDDSRELSHNTYSRRELTRMLNGLDYYNQKHFLDMCPKIVTIRGVHFYSSLVEKALLRLL